MTKTMWLGFIGAIIVGLGLVAAVVTLAVLKTVDPTPPSPVTVPGTVVYV